jgi:hypothetical protein
VSLTTHDSLVIAMDLSPGLFENDDPKLVAVSLGEAWLSIDVAGNMVVNDNGLPLTVFEHPDSKHTLLIDLVRDEHALDSLGVLSQHREHTEEVAITEGSLLDIGRLNLASEHLNRPIHIVKRRDIFHSQPLDVFPGGHKSLDALIGVGPVRNETFGIWHEVLVKPHTVASFFQGSLVSLIVLLRGWSSYILW